MIYIKIGDTFLFSYNTWNEYKSPVTWNDLKTLTWKDILVSVNNISTCNALSNTLRIMDIVNTPSICDFTIYDEENVCDFRKGQPINIYDDDYNILFSGFLDSVTKKHVGSYPSTIGMIYTISAVDNHYLVNKRKMIRAFSEEYIDDAVKWIVDNILASEGIEIGTITASTKQITKIYNYVECKDVLDELAEYAACIWFISADKKLYFIPINTYTATFNIVIDEYGHCEYIKDDTFQVSDANGEYRNTQYLIGSTNKSVLQTQYFKGDGENQTWVCRLPILEQPTIYVNDVEKTVGINQVNTGYDFYWNKNDANISQDSSGTKLLSTDILKVEFYGSYNIVVKSANFSEISAKAVLEGSSGIVEDVSSDNAYTTKNDAIDRTNVILETYGMDALTITYTTRQAGLEAGQLQTITSTIYNINDSCLISQVEKVENEHEIEYNVTVVKGPVQDYWIKQMLKISEAKAKSLQNSFEESSILLILMEFTKNWTEIEDPNIFKMLYPGESVLPGDVDLPCFDTNERCMYMQLNYGSGYRLYMTDQVITETQITTTFIVPSQDCNGSFTQIKFYGGNLATEEIDSGELLSTHDFIYTKNSLESFQIICTYNKWS